MAKPIFEPVFRSAGVDADRRPTGMVVPLGGFNVVRLRDGAGLVVPERVGPLRIEELHRNSGGAALAAVSFSLNRVAPDNLHGTPTFGAWPDSRYFAIYGNGKISATLPTRVIAAAPGGTAALDVAVLVPKSFKVSIRRLQVRGSGGTLEFHSKQPVDADLLVKYMNSIWNRQANISFQLVSQGTAPTNRADLPNTIDTDDHKDLLIGLKDKNADLSMFLVQYCTYDHGTPCNGWTKPRWGYSLISDKRIEMTDLLAHEAGHYLHYVATGEDGGHFGGTKDLMQFGGSLEARIPFDDVAKFNP